MRILFLLFGLTTCAGVLRAQEQENKLVDRLLRPDMTLANSAQNKTFTGTGATSVEKKFIAKPFYSGHERESKSFAGGKDFSAKRFTAEKFSRAERTADAAVKSEPASAKAKFSTSESALIRTASEDGKVAATRPYPNNRPFLAEGTRQKILNQQDKPLTIDEVRELLNKSK